jgi:hypothetical protein
VALVGEARASRDFSQPGLSIVHKFNRALQPQMHHVPMRGHADSDVQWSRQPPPPPAPMLKTPMAAIAGPGPDPKLRYKINLLFNDHFDYLHRESHCAIPSL